MRRRRFRIMNILGTRNPVDILTKPMSIDDVRARLAGVGVSIDWEMSPEQLRAHVPARPMTVGSSAYENCTFVCCCVSYRRVKRCERKEEREERRERKFRSNLGSSLDCGLSQMASLPSSSGSPDCICDVWSPQLCRRGGNCPHQRRRCCLFGCTSKGCGGVAEARASDCRAGGCLCESDGRATFPGSLPGHVSPFGDRQSGPARASSDSPVGA